jgi:beta-N-acetylhexosaminidase
MFRYAAPSLVFLLLLFVVFAACGGKPAGETVVSGTQPPTEEISPYLPGAEDVPYRSRKQEAAAIAAGLDDTVLAAQVIMAGMDNKNYLSAAMKNILLANPAGGLMFFSYNLDAGMDEVRAFFEECSVLVTAGSGLAPFIAVDHEGGMVHRFGEGIGRLPPAASYRELLDTAGAENVLAAVENDARRSAAEIRALGITMNFAPVAEVLNNDNIVFLESRSYGPDSDFTEAAAAAFIRGMDAAGIACVVKHFPGNSAADPHGGPAVIGGDMDALNEMARPFAGIIRELRPPAVMVSHAVAAAVDGERNASRSQAVIGGWLRGELGFPGMVIADDFSMGAVAALGISPAAASVEAIKAGADMVMAWPRSIGEIKAAILNAVSQGSLPRERLVDAAANIIAEKIRYGLVPVNQAAETEIR